MTRLISTLNAAYEVPEGRSWLKVHAVSLGLTVVMAVLIVTALLLVLAGGHLVGFVGQGPGVSSVGLIVGKVLQWMLALAFVVLAFALIYILRTRCQGTALVLDHPRVSSRRTAMGVVFTRSTWLPSFLQ